MGDLNSTADVAVIILTYNEEANIGQALESVQGWARQMMILDSFSTDRTLDIAGRYPCQIFRNRFENYSRQRNFAIKCLPVEAEWILFLDADEWLPPELKEEIRQVIESRPAENGFFIKWRFIFMGKWIRRGYYPTWILRLFRAGKARCEERSVNEHLIVEGSVGRLRHDFMHEDRKGIQDWVAKHNRYAVLEAEELLKERSGDGEIDVRLFGTQSQRKRWLKHVVFNRMPPVLRPFLFFFYRFIIRGGFLDGSAAFIYHFMQALWFPLLIDVIYLEGKRRKLQRPGG